MRRTPWRWYLGIAAGLIVVVTPLLLLGLKALLPAKWENGALTATFDRLGVDTNGTSLVFEYTIHNNTNWDYRRDSGSELDLKPNLPPYETPTDIGLPQIDLPILVMAHARAPLKVRIAILSLNEPSAEGMHRIVSRINGFTLSDPEAHYIVTLPRGW